jgi:hypothetical protein
MNVAMVFFVLPQQPPESKEIEGGVRRLARKSAAGEALYEFEEVNGGLRITRGEDSGWYPGHTILRVRYERAAAKVAQVTPIAKAAGK